MAWWSFVILAAYAYIWLVTGDLGALTSSALVLLGISTATGMASAVVDSNRRDDLKAKRSEIEKDIAIIQPGSKAADPDPSEEKKATPRT